MIPHAHHVAVHPILLNPTSISRHCAALGVQRRYRRGTLLIQEGETGDTLYIVLQGRLRAFLSDEQRQGTHPRHVYGPLEYVGEMSLDGGPRSAHVEAVDVQRVLCGVARQLAGLHRGPARIRPGTAWAV